MSERDDAPPPEAVKPLAILLFGWAFAQRKAGPSVVALTLISAALLGDEAVRGRQGLNLPYEPMFGFYALAGVLAALAVLLIAHALSFALGRLPAPGDEP